MKCRYLNSKSSLLVRWLEVGVEERSRQEILAARERKGHIQYIIQYIIHIHNQYFITKIEITNTETRNFASLLAEN